MYGIEVIATLIVTRILLPVGLLLFIGEWIRGRAARSGKKA